ncbi:undecaprenyl-diphosphatase UppP [Candidatus Daviesbacteria bacterium RIFCSPLOWO2_01_FULL_43_38]|uniref:Undecaprenyl-diphosphatase n=2 Tax=Candidatus Daviesiibacteriota TaxID=1752718 RepID=A0A1F5K104_9BACT|nr:MAG: Undecaprenyl-diphosphatase [Candidatus Daviesbacteria bacterium GW2011_GWA2_42_7]OGE19816.1 MAG: undecaprenyl-diphosphatase UppP [Candidatus Daviesbacteria bacterium RIFCSPHIGHO2_01_FULL_43_17]OGE34593.1 MAG: undecaprenyl-diphosphatase UppP [Candidatus Daviesbacteria bacterium RIFCSPHIGHO2_12_FULL_43_11]OGE63619.1 MAG: undecaprenyl-diphosphatase UppP [Candidatus Daviesbacteria bacterium RIFCSPLOWO2_01_FULL_43_38]
MDFLQALILSIVEGLSEFLPISSTGHLVLASELLGISQTEFVKSFEIIIQLGAILAIVALYAKTLLTNKTVWLRILAAFLPTAIVGFTLYRVIKNFLVGNTTITLAALFLGGIALIILELVHTEKDSHAGKIEDLTLKQSFLIGLIQSLSIIPGVSRSAATIIGGLFVGAKRKTAVEFSFLLAVPTMAAATGLDLLKSGFAFSQNEYSMILVGFAGSFIVAIFAVKFLLKFVQTHTFIPFGIYRIILALLFWAFIVR